MPPSPPGPGRERWIDAAFDALADGGLEAVAVEPLGVRLGVTKGSFYWHFRDRGALIAAVVEAFEVRGADEPIRELRGVADPRARLQQLFHVALGRPESLRSERALLTATDPRVMAAVARVHQKRRAFLEQCYRDLGLSPAHARHWAATAYATFIGAVVLSEQAPFDSARSVARWITHFSERLLLSASTPASPRTCARR
ncbi:MAG: TetR/AcrR family transcriptional regulator [Gemmatimonadaceae bacterium]|nr:TetR/AcrR family transcriptional regulator [Gemmatimonadaceae bacterium]